mmetsp:Transcript_117290/g.239973  ORF Transcript_117290/g.239973 Transcript_117290/m.239973 type:complete len:106 (-) Transcript_117290:62-379(-)
MPGAIGVVLLRVMGGVSNGDGEFTIKISAVQSKSVPYDQNQFRAYCTINQSVSTLSRSACAQQTTVITRNNDKKETQPMVALLVVQKRLSPLTSSVERDVCDMLC